MKFWDVSEEARPHFIGLNCVCVMWSAYEAWAHWGTDAVVWNLLTVVINGAIAWWLWWERDTGP